MDAVKWRGVGVHMTGTPVWQGHLYLQQRREGLDQSRRCRSISDSLLAHGMKMPPVDNRALHYVQVTLP